MIASGSLVDPSNTDSSTVVGLSTVLLAGGGGVLGCLAGEQADDGAAAAQIGIGSACTLDALAVGVVALVVAAIGRAP